MNRWSITAEERNIIRELAKKQLEYSKLPIMREREERWYKHNDLKGEIPMIHFETWTFQKDLLPPLKCTSEAAKAIEHQLYMTILNHEYINDDRVVPSWFSIGWNMDFVLFNLRIEREHSKDSAGRDLGHQFKHMIKNLEQDVHNLKPSLMSVDKEVTMEWKAFVEEILGDILPVRIDIGSLIASLSQNVVHLMGMEAMIFAMVDYPEEFHQLMDRITRDHIEYFKWMEKEGLLLLNNGNSFICQGTFGFTNSLPGKSYSPGNNPVTGDLWGYMDSQETVSISPDMFGEFFFPYYLETAKNFGLLNYGCCEPVHPIWEKYISKLPNLRKVSISPWCDEEYMGNALKGSNVIYHRKPSPNYVGVGKEFDEEGFRQHILKTLKCAEGCKLEFSFRDVYTLEGDISKPRKAVQIVRDLIEDNWK